MTIAQLQEVMTQEEVELWHLYRNKWGPLNPMVRTDAAIARAMSAWANASGVKMQGGATPTMADFMPWPIEEKESDPFLAFAKIMGTKRPSKEGNK